MSAAPIDLTDVRFTMGIDFDFAPGTMLAVGASILVVKNVDAFNMRYGSGRAIAGSYGSYSLMNSGEEIKLSYGIGTAIRDFTYGDTAPWPTSPDGDGYSLVRRFPENLTLDDNLASSWRASVVAGGSPGGDDRPTFDSWAGDHGVTGPLDDGDRDGLSALAEYQLVGDPGENSLAPLPVSGRQTVIVDGTPGEYVTLTFRVLAAAEDVNYAVEFSTDLTSWPLPGVRISAIDQGDGTAIETWRSPNPIGNTQLFGHVRVVKP